MDKEYKSLELSEEEIEAVRTYNGFNHTVINAYFDIDPDQIINARNNAWLLDFSEEEFKKNLDKIQKLYAAMYKYSYKKEKRPDYLVRGTSRLEALNLKDNYSKFVSTSTNREIADRFASYRGDSDAVMEITTDNDVPFINVSEFAGPYQEDEKEILLAPFATVKKNEYVSYRFGRPTHVVHLGKPEFEAMSQDKEKECEESLLENLPKLNDAIKTINNNQKSIEYYDDKLFRLSKDKDKPEVQEEIERLREKVTKMRTESKDLREMIKGMRNSMQSLIQSKLKQVELNIDKNYAIEDLGKKKETLEEKLTGLLERSSALRENMLQGDTRVNQLETYAKQNGITVLDNSHERDEINSKFDTLKKQIEELIATTKEYDATKSFETGDDSLTRASDKTEMVSAILDDIRQGISSYSNEKRIDLESSIVDKIKRTITHDVSRKLSSQLEELSSKKNSLLDRITGKAKLKNAKMDSLRLRLQMVNQDGLDIPSTYNEAINYLAGYRQMIGRNSIPQAMLTMPKNGAKFGRSYLNDPRYLAVFFPENLPVPNGKKMSNRKLAKEISDRNMNLTQRINSKSVTSKNAANSNQHNTNFRFGQELQKGQKTRETLRQISNSLDTANGYSSNTNIDVTREQEALEQQSTVKLFDER